MRRTLKSRFSPFLGRGIAFRVVGWLLLAYFVIAVLHGLAPGLWAKSFGGQEFHGPFRLLIFVPIEALCLIFLALALLLIVSRRACQAAEPQLFCKWTAWSLRGPPHRFSSSF